MQNQQKILFVVTSHDRLGNADAESAERTGFHLAEAAQPWAVLTQAGFDVDIASTTGGKAPIDPGSRDLDDATNRAFLDDSRVSQQLANTLKLDQIGLGAYAAIFFPGGHGAMWDLPGNGAVQHAIRTIYEAGGIVGAVCHGPAAFVDVTLSDGTPLVAGKRISVFTNEEERAVEKDDLVPFLLATTLARQGAQHVKADNFEKSTSVDGRLVTGQNPASAREVGERILTLLKERHDAGQEAA